VERLGWLESIFRFAAAVSARSAFFEPPISPQFVRRTFAREMGLTIAALSLLSSHTTLEREATGGRTRWRGAGARPAADIAWRCDRRGCAVRDGRLLVLDSSQRPPAFEPDESQAVVSELPDDE